jgi:ketosteroid isomerase-like protein
MVRIAITPMLLALLLGTIEFGQETSHKNPVAPALSSFPDRKLMQEIMDAWATLNPHVAAKYYDQSPKDVFFDDAGGLQFVGWQAYEAGLQKVMAAEQQAKWTVNDDAVVHPAGNYAWATATVHAEYVAKGGTRQIMDERWTLIWTKRDGKWLVVHEHFSASPQ